MTMVRESNEPRAWIGCLGCYNDGRLNGEWISLTEAAAEMEAMPEDRARRYLKGTAMFSDGGVLRCVTCEGDEFDCMDTENWPFATPSGWAEFYHHAAHLLEIVEGDSWERIEAVIRNFHYRVDQIDEAVTYDEDHYCGWYESVAEFADEQVANMMPPEMADMTLFCRPLADWIDADEVWRYSLQHDYWTEDNDGGVFVWTN